MKFAHMADVHLGSWREPKLRELSTKSFINAVSKCISEAVDFVLIAGDLFNTSLPSIESLKVAVSQLKRLKDKGIGVYTVAGSHDFSPSGKTMLDVLEEADLVVNVCRGGVLEGRLNLEFTVDSKTGVKLTGMMGKKGMLEQKTYQDLITYNLEQEKGFKIFLFHTALSELKTPEFQKMESASISLLPKNFDYYAGGHVHIVKEASLEGYMNVVYPGPIFPNSFSELEKLNHGGFYIYDDGKISYKELKLCSVVSVDVVCDGQNPSQATEKILDQLNKFELNDSIVLLRVSGVIESGKTSDISFSEIFESVQERGAYLFMKNTNKLSSQGFNEVKIVADTAEEAEQMVIAEYIGQVKSLNLLPEAEKELVIKLMTALDTEKDEGENQSDYELRVTSSTDRIFEK